MGIPTVTIPTSEFIGLAKNNVRSEGAAEAPFVEIPHPVAGISKAELNAKADALFNEIVKVATTWKPETSLPPSTKKAYPADVLKFTGTTADLNRMFLNRKWSLGLPVNPPTPESVAAMLKGTTRKPDEVLGKVFPRMGTLTVELVAVNAVMAGCKPEYMPVILAAIDALMDNKANWSAINTSTGSTGLVIVVNGPIAKEIGLASKQGAAGKGHQPNAAIGYAINLIAGIVGGSLPPDGDKSTFGSPMDFVPWVFGENEDGLPKGWQPYHMDQGFKKTDSVVTVMGIYPAIDLTDHWSLTLDESLSSFASFATPRVNAGGVCRPTLAEMPHLIVLCPEHAKLATAAGLNKEQYRKAFWEKVRQPFAWNPKACVDLALKNDKIKKYIEKNLGTSVASETMMPLTWKPELIHLVVGGGNGRHSHYFAPFYGAHAVSKIVKE